MHRFKALNLVNRVPELWTEVCIIVQETANKVKVKVKQEGKGAA